MGSRFFNSLMKNGYKIHLCTKIYKKNLYSNDKVQYIRKIIMKKRACGIIIIFLCSVFTGISNGNCVQHVQPRFTSEFSTLTLDKTERISNVFIREFEDQENKGSTNISWKKHVIDSAFDYAFGVFVCDVDNDNDSDILGAAKDGDFIAWWRNDGGKPINWTKFVIDDNFDGATSVFAVDIDNDLDIDVVGSAWQAKEIALWINNGETPITWSKYIIKSDFDFAHEVYCHDLDKDGDSDILGVSSDDDQIVWWRNDGGVPIEWTEQIITSDFDGAKCARVADFDNDGLLDVIGAAIFDNEIRLWRNCGGDPIVWEEYIIEDNFYGAHRVEPCDMDFDGDIDIVGAAYLGSELAWWENEGGTPLMWTKHVIATNFDRACIGLPVDIDEDGDIDVIGTAQYGYDVAMFRNDGGDPFAWTKIVIDSFFQGAWPGVVCDIDGDGDTDIVVGASFEDKLAWWESDLHQQPVKPEKPSGTASGKPGIQYAFSSRTTDPFGLELYYQWQWGDGNFSEWIGPYNSGDECNASHIWSKKGKYEIRVKARNIDGAESGWSDPLPVTMPCSSNHPDVRFLEWLFQRFPTAFPILRQLFGY